MSDGAATENLVPEECEHCGGPVREDCREGWVAPPGGAAKPCPGRQARVTEALLEAAEVPELYRGCTVDGLRVDGLKGARQLAAARDACRSYVERFRLDGPDRTSRGLLFSGGVGSGKTHLLAAVLQALVRRTNVRGLFVDFTTLCARIQASFGDDPEAGTETRILRPLLDAHVLALDELGARRPTPFVQDTLYLVINTRHSRLRPTLFSTNHPLEDAAVALAGSRRPALDRPLGAARAGDLGEAAFESLSTRVGPRIYSRLFEATEAQLVLDQVADYRRLPRTS